MNDIKKRSGGVKSESEEWLADMIAPRRECVVAESEPWSNSRDCESGTSVTCIALIATNALRYFGRQKAKGRKWAV